MTEPTPELKPCPFCGGSATIGGLVPWAECGECMATGEACADEPSAAAAWNRRVDPQPPAEVSGLFAGLAARAVPFLRDEGEKYEDDGSNEPLELAREIESALASLPPVESALPSANSAFDGGREATPQPPAEAQGVGEVVGPMTEAEVRKWIDACNHEPARQVLRDYLRLRTAPVGVEALVERWRTKKRDLSALGCANELEHALAQQPVAKTRVIADCPHCGYTDMTDADQAVRRDAKRYRFLRDNNGVANHLGVEVYIDGEAHAPGHLDAQVDAALRSPAGRWHR